MPKTLPYHDGELFVARMEQALDEGDIEFLEKNMPRLEKSHCGARRIFPSERTDQTGSWRRGATHCCRSSLNSRTRHMSST